MFDKLKSLFVVDDSPSDGSKNEEKKETKVNTAEEVAIPSSDDVKIEAGAKPTAKFVNVLMKAIEDANQEGFDYLEYKQSLQSLGSMNMTDETMYQSAYAMAKTMGATSDKLIKSGQFYQNILKKEDAKFQTALIQQKEKQISGRQNEIIKYQNVIAEKTQLIEKLKKEIEAHQNQLKEIESGVSDASDKIENTRKGFAIAYHTVYDQIEKDLQQMKQFLK